MDVHGSVAVDDADKMAYRPLIDKNIVIGVRHAGTTFFNLIRHETRIPPVKNSPSLAAA